MSASPGDRRWRWAGATIAWLAGALCYMNALGGAFVFDDVKLIVNNEFLTRTATLRELFLTDLWRAVGFDTGYYRPLAAVVYRGIVAAFGMHPLPFHAVSVVLHATTAALVFLLVRDLLAADRREGVRARELPALAGALLFAVHPVHVEAVAWISGMMDLGATLCAVAFLDLHARGRGAGVLAPAVLLVGLLFKESAAAAIPLAAAFDLAVRVPSRTAVTLAGRWGGIAAAAAAYAALRFAALGYLATPPGAPPAAAARDLLHVLVPVGAYLRMLVVPFPLNAVADLRVPSSLASLATAGIALPLAAFLATTVVAARARGAALCAVLLIAVPLLPALLVAPADPALAMAFAERYLYFPSVGLALLAAAGLSALEGRGRGREALAAAAALAVVIATGAVATVARNRVWRDDLSLWSDTARKTPELARVRASLGLALYRRGRTGEAAAEFEQARRLQPGLAREYVRTGVAAAGRDQALMAILDFQLALLLDPSDLEAHFNLGVAYQKRGWNALAEASYGRVLALDPDHAGAHNNVAALLAETGRLTEAIAHLETAVRRNPQDAEARLNLARAYALTGRAADAEPERRSAASGEGAPVPAPAP